MADSFAGDPFHEGASQPLAGLKGGMSGVSTQDPMTSEAMDNPRGGNTEAPNTGEWNSTVIGGGSGGGAHGNPVNTKDSY